MPFLTYRCPYMSVPVQGWVVDARDNKYETIICAACKRLHTLNVVTGKLLGEEDD
jgi:hypothetical protein